jgi:hypothetical protein
MGLSGKVMAPSGLSGLDPERLQEWMEKVFSRIRSKAAAWRAGGIGQEKPSAQEAVAYLEGFYTLSVLKATVGAGSGRGGDRGRDRDRDRGRDRDRDRGKDSGKDRGKGHEKDAKGGGGKGGSQGGKGGDKDRTVLSAWPERTQSLAPADFATLRAAATQKYPDHCPFFLVAKCTTKGCGKGSHERPTDFLDFVDEKGFKPDGSVSADKGSNTRAAAPPPCCAPPAAPAQPPRGAMSVGGAGERAKESSGAEHAEEKRHERSPRASEARHERGASGSQEPRASSPELIPVRVLTAEAPVRVLTAEAEGSAMSAEAEGSAMSAEARSSAMSAEAESSAMSGSAMDAEEAVRAGAHGEQSDARSSNQSRWLSRAAQR